MGVKSHASSIFFEKLNHSHDDRLTFAEYMEGMRVLIAGSLTEQLTYAYEMIRVCSAVCVCVCVLTFGTCEQVSLLLSPSLCSPL
jgi:hypothetical protein